MPEAPTRPSDRALGVLISGRGSNLQALIDAIASGQLDAHIAVVISNRRDADGLARARAAGIEAVWMDAGEFATRAAYDAAIAQKLRDSGVRVVCLAGYLRLVGAPLLDAYPNAILNIHPSLLPAFPGLDAQRQALEYGVKVTGITVHFVNAELDAGPIVIQRPVIVADDDSVESLAARILVEEHRAYPDAVRQVLDGTWRVDGRRIIESAKSAKRHPV